MSFHTRTTLRAEFSRRLSDLYGEEVPAYRLLVETCDEINREITAEYPDQNFGDDIARVTEERHGAIRVGTPEELRQAGTIFAALKMEPVGFYDLRDAAPTPIPVVSTAFRPTDPEELATNPFRVFCSQLVPEDRRFFDADVEGRIQERLGQRTLFPERVLELARKAESGDGLEEAEAEEFLTGCVDCFRLSHEPIDQEWYEELEEISSVAADIAGVGSTHINHLTPRVLDIDELYTRMESKGVTMIDKVQGPIAWGGPDFLLRQTSFRALSEPRMMRDATGCVFEGSLRVRFGEVEARGLALTPGGRDRYETVLRDVEKLGGDAEAARRVYSEAFPWKFREFVLEGLAYATFRLVRTPKVVPAEGIALSRAVAEGLISVAPITYEDFLPRSAAGIFSSNLSSESRANAELEGQERDITWMGQALGRTIRTPEEIYAAEEEASLAEVERRLGAPLIRDLVGARDEVAAH